MRAEFTQYAVPGWGVGELWTGGDLLLAHEFRFQPVSDTGAEAGWASSPNESVAPARSRSTIARREAEISWGEVGTVPARSALDTIRCLTPGVLVERFTAFLAGADVRFDDVPLELGWATSFQRAIADALRTVPRGEVVSYGELAALAGNARAPRAAGTFCAQNRFMFVLPCHRVVGAGGIGGYGTVGVAVKRRLLALEDVVL